MTSFYFLYFVYMFISFYLCSYLSNFEKSNVLIYFSFLDKTNSLSFFDFIISLNWLNILFLSVLLLISGSVGMFSITYMAEDPNASRFFYILNLFMLSMMVLMIVPHYVFFLLGWDGLGFTSFLLMKYYNSKISWFSSFKTFLINRLGDGMLLSSMAIYLFQGHFWFFFEFFNHYMLLYCILGLLTKSAHVPFSSWLPAAMAAPTPVSALVHSSTLVTAGIYILIRLSFFFSSFLLLLILFLGMLTILLGGLSALISFDSKKVVAYSTLSNLGFLGVSVGLGCIGVAMFHLFTHGISKALLFISVGNMMETTNHNQDLRNFSKISKKNLFTLVCLVWSILSLLGAFFLSCFYSKDYLFEVQQASPSLNMMIFWVLNITVLITYLYSFRLISFFSSSKNKMFNKFFPFQLKIFKFCSKIFLFLGVLFFGFFFQYFFLFDFESFSISKMIFYTLFFFTFVVQIKSLDWVSAYHYFNGGFWFGFVHVGDFIFNMFDLGLFSKMNSSILKVLYQSSQLLKNFSFGKYVFSFFNLAFISIFIWYLMF